jgi:hypothetical protein
MVMSSLEAEFTGFLAVFACPKAGKELAGNSSMKHKSVIIDFEVFIISIFLCKLLIQYSKVAGDKLAAVAPAVSLSFPLHLANAQSNRKSNHCGEIFFLVFKASGIAEVSGMLSKDICLRVAKSKEVP